LLLENGFKPISSNNIKPMRELLQRAFYSNSHCLIFGGKLPHLIHQFFLILIRFPYHLPQKIGSFLLGSGAEKRGKVL
jgi:hypothetical protein